jgi:hypothetical protein
MRSYDAATAAHLAARPGIVSQLLVWIEAPRVGETVTETIGLWSGEEDLTVTIDGVSRTYQGAGTLLQSEPIRAAAGLSVRVHRLMMAAVAPEVEDLIKGYETRFAPVEMRRALFDPETRQMVSEPHRIFRGMINEVEFQRAEPGGIPACVVDVVSETRALTRTLASKKSDATHRQRAGDRFRRYGDIAGSVSVYWGEKKADGGASRNWILRDLRLDLGWTSK